jgi:hypothetical protein
MNTLNLSTIVILNSFQDPFRRKRNLQSSSTAIADGDAALGFKQLGLAAQWVLKQVQDDGSFVGVARA